MMSGFFRRTAPWQDHASVDFHRTLRVEETLAHVRLVMVLLSLGVAVLDTPASPLVPGGIVLVLLTVYSLAALMALRAGKIRSARHIALFHVVDTGGVLLALLLTGGAVSPYSTLFLFVLLAAGYRWGRRETWMTAAAGVLVLGGEGLVARFLLGSTSPNLHIVALRVTYALIGGILIGYMAETERIQRSEAWLVSRLLGRMQPQAGLVAAVRAVLDDLIGHFRATHAVLVFEDDASSRVSLWHAERQGGGSDRPVIRLHQEGRNEDAVYSLPIPAAVDAFKVRRARPDSPPGRANVAAFDKAGARLHEPFSVAPLFRAPFEWRTALCVAALGGEGWRGRLILFMPFDPPEPRAQLGYLRGIARQVGPALFNLYLERRLESRAGVVERTRISRELHDGVIQSLIGVEMQLEVVRRQAAEKAPDPVLAQLANIQRLLAQEILNVRDLMQLLRPAEVDPKRLVEHLADMIERFRHGTGIQARLACDSDEIDLTPRACREVAGMVREALANVRKHSGATSVVIRLERHDGHWQLVVDDNGCGLDFEGYLTPEQVDAQRKGPAIIKERARAIGGRMALRSQRGFGTRIEISIPQKHHA